MISRRSLEAATATLTGAFGIAVAYSSLDNGVAWTTSGVDSGTFPFFTGLLIVAGSAINFARGWLRDNAILLRAGELKRLAGLFMPALVYVAAIPLVGIYVASLAYVYGTLALQNGMSAVRAAIAAAVVTAALYLLFERMFQVSLPRGMLGAALGY